MSYRINGTCNGRSADLADCEDDVDTLAEARVWANAVIDRLTASERTGLRVWIDEHVDGSIKCVEILTGC